MSLLDLALPSTQQVHQTSNALLSLHFFEMFTPFNVPASLTYLPWPSDPQRVLQAVEKEGLRLLGILTTHTHWDHAGGNEEIRQRDPTVKVSAAAPARHTRAAAPHLGCARYEAGRDSRAGERPGGPAAFSSMAPR